eukprot:scaffold3136_cov102-Cylindrotheca_fusiformis.AAC.1
MKERDGSKKRKSTKIEKVDDQEFFVYTSKTKDNNDIRKKTLTHLRVDSSVREIPERAFKDYDELKVVQLLETVTSIGRSAFASCDKLECVQLVPEGFTQETYPINPCLEAAGTAMFPERAMLEIQDEAFYHCSSLRNVNICSISTRFGKGVFKYCFGLISVQLPEGLQVIGVEFFSRCNSLPTIKIPSSVIKIGHRAFNSCAALKHVQLPETVTSIGRSAFSCCYELELVQFVPEGSRETYPTRPSLEADGAVMFPEKAKLVIEDEAFCYCSSIRKVNVCSVSTRLGKGVFQYCSGLISVQLPEGLQVIEEKLFYGCQSLPTIKIPSSVINIGSCAFTSCRALKHVLLPETVTTIGRSAFAFCYKLELVQFVPEGSQETYPINPSLEAAGTVMFPERAMLEIEDEAFCRCESLRKVIVSSTSTRLGKGVFKDCSGLISVDLPEGLQVIGAEWFSSCKSLPTIKIPSSVIKIGSCAFASCTALKHLKLPEAVTSIGRSAFANCKTLEFVQFVLEGSQETYPINPSFESAGTVVFPERAMLEIQDEAFYHCSSLRKVIVSSISTRLGKGVFEYCFGLISVDLSEGLQVIEAYLFYGCQSLPTIKIPSSVTEIGHMAFGGCSSFSTIKIPSSVIKIGSCAFKKCTALKDVQLPETLASIGSSAFAYCCKLEFVQFVPEGSQETYPINPSLEAAGTVMFPERAMLQIEDEAFYYCSSLRKVIASSISTRLGKGVFKYCSGLISVQLPEGLQVIEAELFNGCYALPTIKIPSSVIKIGERAFMKCHRLTSVGLLLGLVDIGEQAFEGCQSIESLHVPSTVATIGKRAFALCCGLAHIKLPPTLERIAEYLFLGCKSMENIAIPLALKTIGGGAFNRCSSLSHMRVPASIDRIGNTPFLDCRNFISIELPEGILFSADIFECNSLVNVAVPVLESSLYYQYRMDFMQDSKLGRVADQRYDDLVRRLKHRFDGSPLNKLCYYQSYYSTEDAVLQLRRLMEDDPLAAVSQVDEFGMTPLHILSLAQTPNMDMLLAVMKAGHRDHIIQGRDSFGSTPMDYLCLNRTPDSTDVIRRVLETRFYFWLNSDQPPSKKSDTMWQAVDEALTVDWSSRSREIGGVYFELA